MARGIKKVMDENGCLAYDCGDFNYIKLKKGSIASDHKHEEEEIIFLMEGEAELILSEEVQTVKAPARIVIPSNTYHKFTALSDSIGIELKK